MDEGRTAQRPIQILSPAISQRIAAGEVIERPSAVVRELVENALDAQARTIEVAIRGAGLESITVSDDGHGIPADQLSAAFARHGTSKVRDLVDLEGITTLGFRGEALPSIAAVASVEATTAIADASAGVTVLVRDSEILEQRPVARTVGTTMRVRDLFTAQPVRRSFLPSARAESARISTLMRRYALAWPEVRFVLTIDGRVALRTSGMGEASAITAVFGAAARRLHPFGPLAAGHARIGGYLGDPGLTRGDRDGIVLIVNRRWVTPARWLAALESAYRPLLKPGRHPVLVLRVEVAPERLDVNLHPAKLEVRLADEDESLTALAAAIKAHLGRTPKDAVLLRSPEGHARQASLPVGRRVIGERPAGYDAEMPDLARLHILGQVQSTLIAAQDDAGLYLIDQHRADERAIYDAMADAARGRETQELLQPVHVELRHDALEALDAALPELARLGFRCERFGRRAFLVRAVPPGMPEQMGTALAEAVGELGGGEDWREHLLISVACRSALRRGEALTREEMEGLLSRLARCTATAICPHGSPIIVRIDAADLARHFEWR
jgi:DNA mismatch repair protein MutL